MPRWAAFLGLTGVVLTLLLALARLSQQAVRDGPPALSPGQSSDEDGGTGEAAGAPDRVTPAGESGGAPDAETVSTSDTETASVSDTEPVSTPGREPGPTHRAGARDFSTGELLANVAFTQGAFGLVLVVGAWYFRIPPWAFGLGGDWSGLAAVGLGVAVGVILWLGNELAAGLADAVGAAYDEQLRGMLAPESPGGWALLVGLVLPIIAVVEELLFRGALIGVPVAGLAAAPWPLAVVSSVAFALGHGAQGRVGIVVTGGLGLALAGAYVLSGSLLVVVVAHYLVNALEFLVHELLDYGRV